MDKYKKTKFNSGINLVKVPMKGVDSITCMVFCNTGSRYEREEHFGLAHFFEHMVFKGTEKYPNATAITRVIDGIGASFNAFTSYDYTAFYIQSAITHSSLAFDILSDLVFKAQLRQEDIDKERGVIIEEINMYKDNPPHHISNLFDEMLFNGSGLGHPIAGYKNTVNQIQQQDFQDFVKYWYQPHNLVIIVAGNLEYLNSTLFEDNIRQAFESKLPASYQEKFILNDKKSKFSTNKLLLEYRQTEQAHFVLGYPSVDRFSKERFAAKLLCTILGGNMSSRLFEEIREKRGLCYYIDSDLDQYADTGVLSASAGVDANRVEEAIKTTIEEFMAISTAKKAITGEELSRAKEYLIGRMILQLESSQQVAQYYGLQQLLLDFVETPQEYAQKLKAVSLEEISEFAHKYFLNGELRLAIIGPYKDQDKFMNLLK